MLLASAKIDANIPPPSSPEKLDDKINELSRLVILECHLGREHDPFDIRIDKIGECHFDGPVNGSGLRAESNGIYSS
jgi:hypothetical protein